MTRRFDRAMQDLLDAYHAGYREGVTGVDRDRTVDHMHRHAVPGTEDILLDARATLRAVGYQTGREALIRRIDAVAKATGRPKKAVAEAIKREHR